MASPMLRAPAPTTFATEPQQEPGQTNPNRQRPSHRVAGGGFARVGRAGRRITPNVWSNTARPLCESLEPRVLLSGAAAEAAPSSPDQTAEPAIEVSIEASRLWGLAPLAVFFDAIGRWGSAFCTDPVLGSTDPNNVDFLRPAATSPVIDAGTPVAIHPDHQDKQRPLGAAFDIGAFEFGTPPSNRPPIVGAINVTAADADPATPGLGPAGRRGRCRR